MRFAWLAKGAVALAAGAICAPLLHCQINPHTQIKWPSNCTSGDDVYNFTSNTCIANGTAANPAGANGDFQYNQNGIFGAYTPAQALTALGALPTGGGTMTGTLSILLSLSGLPESQLAVQIAGTTMAAPNSAVFDVFPPGYGSFENGIIFEDFATSNSAIYLGKGPSGTYSQALEFVSRNNYTPVYLYGVQGTLEVGNPIGTPGFLEVGTLESATRIQALSLCTATSAANCSSSLFEIVGSSWNGAAAVSDGWILQNLVPSGNSPYSRLVLENQGANGSTNSLLTVYATGDLSVNGGTGADPGHTLYVAGDIYSTASITVEGTGNAVNAASLYANVRIEAEPTGTAISGTNYDSSFVELSGSYYSSGAALDGWLMQNHLGAGSTPTSVLYFSHSGYAGSTNPLLDLYVSGDLGIGSGTATDPGYKLYVNGTGYFTGSVQVSGSAGSGNAMAAPSLYANTRIQAGASGTAISGTNYNSSPIEWVGSYYNASAQTDGWTVYDVMGTGTTPTSNLLFSHSGSSGTASVTIPYTLNATYLVLNSGTYPVYRCLTAGVIVPAGTLTVVSADCGTSSLTTLTVN